MSGSELQGQEAACVPLQAHVTTTVNYLHRWLVKIFKCCSSAAIRLSLALIVNFVQY